MKQYFRIIFLSVLVFSFAAGPLSAQKKKAAPPGPPPQPPVLSTPQMVAIDAPPPLPITFNLSEMKFGSQGVGVQSCMYVKIVNEGKKAIKVLSITSDDAKNYIIPSPSQKMFPVTIQPSLDMTVSVCFTPDKLGEFTSRLVLRAESDSVYIPISGKGIKSEDIAKLPKNDIIITKPKKKKGDWSIKLQLINPSKVTMQLFDELGNLKMIYYNAENKDEGVYEAFFDGLDKDKKKLPPGKYYVRCMIEDSTRNTKNIITKTVTVKG